MGVGGQHHGLAILPQERDAVTIVQEAGWAPGSVRRGAENFIPIFCYNVQDKCNRMGDFSILHIPHMMSILPHIQIIKKIQ
jgi:hypothetical protein